MWILWDICRDHLILLPTPILHLFQAEQKNLIFMKKIVKRTVGGIPSHLPRKVTMPDTQWYPLKLCLIKYELGHKCL